MKLWIGDSALVGVRRGEETISAASPEFNRLMCQLDDDFENFYLYDYLKLNKPNVDRR